MTYAPPAIPPACYSAQAPSQEPSRAHTAEELDEAQRVLDSLGATREQLTRESTTSGRQRYSQTYTANNASNLAAVCEQTTTTPTAETVQLPASVRVSPPVVDATVTTTQTPTSTTPATTSLGETTSATSPVAVGDLMAPRCTSSGSPSTSASVTNTGAIRASDFTRTLAVEGHFRNGGPYTLANVQQAMAYLNPNGAGTGVATLRDDTYSSPSDLAAMGAAGYKLDLYQSYNPSGNNTASQSIDMLTPLVQAGYVRLLEGPLEVDNGGWGISVHGGSYTASNGQTTTGYAGAAAMSKDLLNAFGGSVPVATASMADPGNGAAGGALAQGANALGGVGAIASMGNVHYYPHGGNPPNVELAGTIAQETGWTSGMPFVITETGFNDAGCASYCGNKLVNAGYTLNLVLDAFKAGSKLTALYEMFDEPQYDGTGIAFEAHWGLFNADGTPKPSATSLRNLMTIIGDAGSDAATFQNCGTVDYTLSGLPAAGQSLLTQKADGTYNLIIWNDQNTMSGDGSSHNVAVNLGGNHTYSVFDPLSGTTAARSGSGSSLNVAVSDHPIVIQLAPQGSAQAAQ